MSSITHTVSGCLPQPWTAALLKAHTILKGLPGVPSSNDAGIQQQAIMELKSSKLKKACQSSDNQPSAYARLSAIEEARRRKQPYLSTSVPWDNELPRSYNQGWTASLHGSRRAMFGTRTSNCWAATTSEQCLCGHRLSFCLCATSDKKKQKRDNKPC